MRRKAAPPSLSPEAYAVIEARHYDPFRYLGPHQDNGRTIVRALLVPALMRIAGRWNWWAPKPLARLHARLGLAHD